MRKTQLGRQTDGRMDGRTDGWMDGRTDGWMDGRTDGRRDRPTGQFTYLYSRMRAAQ